MKKIVVFTLVVALLALAVTPAFAQGGSGKGKNMNGTGGGGDQLQYNYAYAGEEVFHVSGVVTAVAAVTDPVTGATTGSVTLDLVAANHLAHDLLDVELPSITLVITETTRIVLACNSDDVVECAVPGTLAVGQNVSAQGLFDGTTYTAQHIAIGAALTGTMTQAPQFQNQTGRPADAGRP
jgi:hypothetical protein